MTTIREPFNSLSHLAGAVLAVWAAAAMTAKAFSQEASALQVFAVTIFGLTLIFLYSASAIYHWVKEDGSAIRFFRKVDHAMIYVLIAGSYAPFCLITLQGKLGWSIFLLVSALAVIGILLTMTKFSKYRKTSSAIYILMGWVIIIAFKPLASELSASGVSLLVAGGILYTIGGVLYGIEKALNNRNYHKVFHVFTLFGSFAHVAAVYFYVI